MGYDFDIAEDLARLGEWILSPPILILTLLAVANLIWRFTDRLPDRSGRRGRGLSGPGGDGDGDGGDD